MSTVLIFVHGLPGGLFKIRFFDRSQIYLLTFKITDMIDFNKPVKFKTPCKGEEKLIYKIVNYNELTQRCYIELICEWTIKPQELVFINDIENI